MESALLGKHVAESDCGARNGFIATECEHGGALNWSIGVRHSVVRLAIVSGAAHREALSVGDRESSGEAGIVVCGGAGAHAEPAMERKPIQHGVGVLKFNGAVDIELSVTMVPGV